MAQDPELSNRGSSETLEPPVCGVSLTIMVWDISSALVLIQVLFVILLSIELPKYCECFFFPRNKEKFLGILCSDFKIFFLGGYLSYYQQCYYLSRSILVIFCCVAIKGKFIRKRM